MDKQSEVWSNEVILFLIVKWAVLGDGLPKEERAGDVRAVCKLFRERVNKQMMVLIRRSPEYIQCFKADSIKVLYMNTLLEEPRNELCLVNPPVFVFGSYAFRDGAHFFKKPDGPNKINSFWFKRDRRALTVKTIPFTPSKFETACIQTIGSIDAFHGDLLVVSFDTLPVCVILCRRTALNDPTECSKEVTGFMAAMWASVKMDGQAISADEKCFEEELDRSLRFNEVSRNDSVFRIIHPV